MSGIKTIAEKIMAEPKGLLDVYDLVIVAENIIYELQNSGKKC